MEREWRISRMRAFLTVRKEGARERELSSGHRNRSKEVGKGVKYPCLFILVVLLRRFHRLNSVCGVGRKREADKCLERAR